MSDRTRAYIALGSNLSSELGDRPAHIRAAIEALGSVERTTVAACSRVIETDPVGPQDQDRYLNAVAAIDTGLAPQRLLEELLRIERDRGRDRARERRWGPRTLDLDLLLYGDQLLNLPGLVVPHPRMRDRLFVLEPLGQVAPDLVVPGTGATVLELAARLRGRT